MNQRIMGLRIGATMNAVDLAREDRLAKADKILESFKLIITNPKFLRLKMQAPSANTAGRGGGPVRDIALARKISDLANKVDNDIEFFLEKAQGPK